MIIALGLGALTGASDPSSEPSSDPQAPLTLAAPPRADADAAACAKVLAQLPVRLGRLDARVVRSDSPSVVAWGDPAVVLRCGVNRPKALKAGSAARFLLGGNPSGPYYDVTRDGDGNRWTTVDRSAYVSVSIPGKYQGGDVMPLVSRAIAKALPAVCTTDSSTADLTKLCTRRK